MLIYKSIIAGALSDEETARKKHLEDQETEPIIALHALRGRGRERAGSRIAPRNRQKRQLRAVFSVATCGVFLDTLR